MRAFQLILVLMIIGIIAYTGVVSANYGWNLFQIFFSDIVAMNWPGQFNFDFSCFLIFSGSWLAWRNNFTPFGIVLGLFGVVGGIMLLAPYLLFVTVQAKGDMKEILLGKIRANS